MSVEYGRKEEKRHMEITEAPLSPEEVKERLETVYGLKKSIRTIYEWFRTGYLPVDGKLGGRWGIYTATLDSFVEKRLGLRKKEAV